MNIWVLVTLVGVVALAFGPILLLQPSAAQRRQAQLRSRAMELGLKVSIGALPRQNTDLEPPGQMAIYRLPRHHRRGPAQRWLLRRAAYAHEQHFLQHWAWQSEGRPGPMEQIVLADIVAPLPESVLGLGADSSGWYVYWTESPQPGELEHLWEALNALSQVQQAQGKTLS